MYEDYNVYEVAGDGSRAIIGRSPYPSEAREYAGKVLVAEARIEGSTVVAIVVEGADSGRVVATYNVAERRAAVERAG